MIYLTEGEKKLMDAVTTHFEKTVLLLNTAGFLEIGEYAKKFSAVLFMGLPGQDAGAVADVLTGSVLPSGHLTDTWPLSYTQYPTAKEYSQKHFNGNIQTTMGQQQEQVDVAYSDDIYVGYRYFDSFGEDVLYPFGYGLGYGKTELAGLFLCSYRRPADCNRHSREYRRRVCGTSGDAGLPLLPGWTAGAAQAEAVCICKNKAPDAR